MIKKLIILFTSFLTISCNNSNENKIPDNQISVSDHHIEREGKYLLFNKKKFTGYLIDIDSKGYTVLKVGYLNGRKENLEKIWHTNGKISEIRYYKEGKKVGKHELFWENGNKKMVAYYKNGEHHGEMKQWHENGFVYKVFNYNNGHEKGNQKIWNNKGIIKANYDVVNGRRYGLTGIMNCKSVFNEL